MVATTAQNPGNSLLDILLSQYAPQLAAGNVGIAQGQEALQLDPQVFGLQQQLAGAQYGNQLAQLGLSQQQLGLSAQGIGLEQGYLGQEQGIAGQQYGLQQQGLAEQLAQLQYNYPLQVQQQQGSAAAQGTTNTVGQGQAMNTLAQYYGPGGWNQQDIQRQQQSASLSNQLQQAGFNLQGGQLGLGLAGIGLSGQQLGLEGQLAGAEYGYSTAQAGIAGALQQGQDLSSLAQQIAGQAGTINQAGQQLGVIQGAPFSMPAQPNPGN